MAKRSEEKQELKAELPEEFKDATAIEVPEGLADKLKARFSVLSQLKDKFNELNNSITSTLEGLLAGKNVGMDESVDRSRIKFSKDYDVLFVTSESDEEE